MLTNRHTRVEENCSDSEPKVKSRAFAKMEDRIAALEGDRDSLVEELKRQREDFAKRLADLECTISQLSRERRGDGTQRAYSRSFDFVWKRR